MPGHFGRRCSPPGGVTSWTTLTGHPPLDIIDMMQWPARLCPVVLFVLTAPWFAAPAHGAGKPDDLLLQGYDLSYNLDHAEAVEALTRAIDRNPNDPAAHRDIAAITWLRVLFLRGAILVDNYQLGSVSRAGGKVQRPPTDLDETFKVHVERAIELAEEGIRRTPDAPDAHYELGASVALAASYKASIEGEPLRALRDAKRAYAAHEKVLELDPRRKDANLTLGIYQYVMSTLPRAFRMLAYLVGFDGGRAEAIRLIEEAAGYPGETRPEAQFALVLLYNQEREYGAAQRVLNDLKRHYPRNRLVWLESASTWLCDERALMAERTLAEGFSKLTQDSRPRMYGEEAVWQLKRGSARVARGLVSEALPDLISAGNGETTVWVKGHAHLELGKVADLEGDRSRAREEYDQGRKLCGKAKHKKCVETAKRLKEYGYSVSK